jgi:uncharacterized protein (TIGR03435 family)
MLVHWEAEEMAYRLVRALGPGARVILMLAGSVAAASSQAQAPVVRPQFEVVSIKPRAPGATDFSVRLLPGGRLSAKNTTALNLILIAWGTRHYQLFGGPDCLRSDHFDVEGRTDANPSRDEMKLMVQSLLEDRFKLRTHRETRELPVYVLTVAKGGPKLQRFKDSDCVKDDPAAPPVLGEKSRNTCGNSILMKGNWNASGVGLDQVAFGLADITDRPVIDKTGLTGKFTVHMEYPEDPLATQTHPARRFLLLSSSKSG